MAMSQVPQHRRHCRSYQPVGLQPREQERRREPRGREEQAGDHQRLHVQRSHTRGLRRNRNNGAARPENGLILRKECCKKLIMNP